MSRKQYTYRFSHLLIGAFITELVFWLLLYVVLSIFGYFDNDGSGKQIDFRFQDATWLFILIIPFWLVQFYSLRRANLLVYSVGKTVQKHIFSPVSTRYTLIKAFLFRFFMGALILAMAQPVFGTKKVSRTMESLELVVCLDISNSMNTCDIEEKNSRLDISKRALIELINNLHGEKLGLCVFANEAFVQLPLTIDYHAAKMYINEVETSMLSNQGTNIKAAIETAENMFSKEKTSKALLIVTDGENHEEDPSEVLKLLREKEIQLSVLGVGTEKGGLVPKNPERPELGFLSTSLGTSVLSKVNPVFIKKIASLGGGTASISDSRFPNLSRFLTHFNQMKRTKIPQMEFDIKENRYQVPLVIALIFMVLFLVVPKLNNQ